MDRLIETEASRKWLLAHIKGVRLPITVAIRPGRHRSVEQNALQWAWFGEIAHQKGWTVREVRNYAKLHLALPILLASDPEMRKAWTKIIAPLPYPKRLALMEVLPVTSRMNTPDFTAYLDDLHRHFSKQGVVLEQPNNEAA